MFEAERAKRDSQSVSTQGELAVLEHCVQKASPCTDEFLSPTLALQHKKSYCRTSETRHTSSERLSFAREIKS